MSGGGDRAGNVLVQVEAVERHPAGQEDVDQHERVVVGKVDVAVVRGVVGAVPREVNTLPAHVECVLGLEGDVRDRPGRVVLACQQLPGLDLPDPHHVLPEQRRAADVVGVVVGVDQVGHLVRHPVFGGDLVDGALQVVPDRRRRVEQHDPVAGSQERRLIGTVGDPVQVLLHPPHEVALRVDRRAQRGRRYRRVVGQGAGRRRCGEGAPGQGGDRGDGRYRRAAGEERAAVRG